jgi:MFS family permease
MIESRIAAYATSIADSRAALIIRYKRYELASRFSIYYTATAVSGAFSGLLAGVITQYLDGARGYKGWQWLFVRLFIFPERGKANNQII